MKAYRYLIYKIYSWSLNKKNDTPIGNTILSIGTALFFYILILFNFINKFVTPFNWTLYSHQNQSIVKSYMYLCAPIYFGLLYFVLYKKERWDAYVKEFSGESATKSILGTVFAIIFLIGGLLLLFITDSFFS